MANLKIYVAGHNGMVGSSLVRLFQKKKEIDLITAEKKKLNLIDQAAVQNFFKKKKIDQVYIAAAKVGGVYSNNTYPAEFIYENLMIQTNIIHSAFLSGVKKVLFLGSSCIYPKEAKQPMKEDTLLTGTLEPTNLPYAIAKIAGIKLCESYNRQYGQSHGIDYRSVMPTNLYGPGDSYHPENSHVIPSLIYRFHKAKISNAPNVAIWGTGVPRREFLYVDDMARACIHIMNLDQITYHKHTKLMCSHINVGSGKEVTIKELAKIIKSVVGYQNKIVFDSNKLDGSQRKFIDSKLINSLGWRPEVSLKEGLIEVYKDFLKA